VVETEKIGHRARLRESFIRGGKTAFTDVALLELLLSYAIPRRDVQPLAKELIERFGGLSGVLSADLETLCKSKGMGLSSAVLLMLNNWIRSHYPLEDSDQTKRTLSDPAQASLFDLIKSSQGPPKSKREKKPSIKKNTVPKPRTGLFANAVLKEAISLLPTLPDTDSLNEVRGYLRKNLHYSAEQTRQRYANYIIRRMFPKGTPDKSICLFARHFQGSRDLQEVCYYRFIKTETLMQKMAEEVLIPSLGIGQVRREKIRAYLADLFPSSRSIKNSAKAVINVLDAGGIARSDRKKIIFRYRDIPISAFAFVLHSEFPVPSMYDIAKLDTNPAIKTMLWNPDKILSSLYELRNKGLISKISEIDNIRQFTTRWTLDQLVERLVAAGKKV